MFVMSLPYNLESLRVKIADSAALSKRTPADITMVAVSKMQEDARIDAALSMGLRVFGENRVQEAQARWATGESNRRATHPDIELHLIGPLQTNKAADAVALFDVIETIDRADIADAIAKECSKQGKNPLCFVQVNTGDEPQKSGVSLGDLPALLQHCRDIKLNVQGLMCIPPATDPAAFHFALLKKLAARHNLKLLSMGMSNDFERGIELGATHIRLGTALFGERTA